MTANLKRRRNVVEQARTANTGFASGGVIRQQTDKLCNLGGLCPSPDGFSAS